MTEKLKKFVAGYYALQKSEASESKIIFCFMKVKQTSVNDRWRDRNEEEEPLARESQLQFNEGITAF